MGHPITPWGKTRMRRIDSVEMGDVVRHTNGKFVCPNCFGDEGVKNFINEFSPDSDEWAPCSYCAHEQGLHLDWVVEHIFENPFARLIVEAEGYLPFSYEAGGYIGTTLDSADALWECDLGVESEPLFDDIVAALPDKEWARKGDIERDEREALEYIESERSEEKMSEWRKFAHRVKYERRYFFLRQFPMEEIAPSHILEELVRVVKDTADEIPCGEVIYRSRVGYFCEDAEIKEPPPAKALWSNRMSPAGIPMFYGCYAPEVARRETYDKTKAKSGDVITVGKFECIKSIGVIDLADFDAKISRMKKPGESALFLRRFVREIAQRVSKDGQENIEYVPTQIFTEYLRMKLSPDIGGIVYPSAISNHPPENKQGTCVVLFNSKRLRPVGKCYFRVSVEKVEGEEPIVKFHPIALQGGTPADD